METRRIETSHMTFNASGNTHLPGDFSGYVVTCKGCDFTGIRWEFLKHLRDLGVCWSCHGRGTFKFRTIPDRSYDRDCTKCDGTGNSTAPLPPKPKDSSYAFREPPAQ
jgi:DnaJ-class molecular chaperone